MVLATKIDTHSESFLQNFQFMKQQVMELKKALKQARLGGGTENQKRHKLRNKYLARERIENLKDSETSFLEFSALAGKAVYKEILPSAGILTGVIIIQGRPCVVIANDATVKGGTYFPMTIKKHLRAQEIALENHLPCIYLVDSGGAYLPYQDQVFPDREHFGRIFYNQVRMSAKGIAQISVVLGHCIAGGAYVPALSDENIIVKGNGTIFLGGPPLVEAATGEKVEAQELGGADVHTSLSGVSDYMAEDEDSALQKVREIVLHLGRIKKQSLPCQENRSPLYSPEEMYGVIPFDLKKTFDMKEMIARLVDGSEFFEFKENYGRTLVTGWAHICGFPVGVLANNGVLLSESALKATHFIDLCDQRGTPLLFLQNIVGFMVGKKYENEGITKQGAKMVSAVSLARVPKFTVIMGASYGAGNYGMCGRAYQPRQLWIWPSARIAVMGGTQAQKVLSTVKTRSKKKEKHSSESSKEHSESLIEQYDRQSSAYYSTARLWDDGLIDPIDTRRVVALGIDASLHAPLKPRLKGIYRM